jgi:hypothetical protein
MPNARTEVKLPVEEMYARAGAQPPDFPKYTTQLMNLANQNAQGTRPEVVGQMSELVREADPVSFSEWKQWYEERHPDALARATERIADHVEKLKQAIKAIDRDMIRDWVKDLVLIKTVEGLLIERAVLDYLAEVHDVDYTPATTAEESKGIDGYLGDVPVSVKPHTYKSKTSVKQETLSGHLILYRKTSKYLTIWYDLDVLEQAS